MLDIKKEVRNFNRFKEIVLILFEEGFGYLLSRIKLKHHLPLTKRVKKSQQVRLKPEVRLRKTLERLGPTFIKLGQMLSVRPDLLPWNYIKELEKLQGNVPPFSFTEVKKQIESELKKPINKIFKKFEEEPIASASISQVHKAYLKNNKVVAVKVQRPEVRLVMEEDIEIMNYIAILLEKNIKGLRKFRPRKIVKEFSDWTYQELEFLIEARNAKTFALNFKDNNNVKIPKVYDEYTSNKVLTLEFIYGTELNKIDELKKRKVDLDLVLQYGFEAVLTQVFLHGFFHADPHPGNILVTRHNKIAFVDFGIIGRFDDDLKEKAVDLLYSLVFHDVDKLIVVLEDMGMEDITNLSEFKHELRNVVEPMEVGNIENIKLSKVIEEVLHLALKRDLKLPLEFTLLGKTIITLEGIGLEYNPKFRLINNARPFVENLMLRRLHPANMADSLLKNVMKFKKFTEDLPDETTRALRKIQKGTIKVDLSDTDIKRLSIEIDKSSNRVAYSMLITGFIITGALTISVDFGMRIFSIPVISFLCFLFGLFFGMMLIVSILREQR